MNRKAALQASLDDWNQACFTRLCEYESYGDSYRSDTGTVGSLFKTLGLIKSLVLGHTVDLQLVGAVTVML